MTVMFKFMPKFSVDLHCTCCLIFILLAVTHTKKNALQKVLKIGPDVKNFTYELLFYFTEEFLEWNVVYKLHTERKPYINEQMEKRVQHDRALVLQALLCNNFSLCNLYIDVDVNDSDVNIRTPLNLQALRIVRLGLEGRKMLASRLRLSFTTRKNTCFDL